MKLRFNYLLLVVSLWISVAFAGETPDKESFLIKMPKYVAGPICNKWVDIKDVTMLHNAFVHSTDEERRVVHTDETLAPHKNARTLFDAVKAQTRDTLKIPKKVDDTDFKSILRKISTMKHLSLIECEKITDIGFAEIKEHCLNLITLDLRCCIYLVDAVFIKIAEYCPHLTTLRLYRFVRLTNLSMIKIAEYCPHLTTLKLKYSCQFTHVALIEIAKHCLGLTALDISNSDIFTDADINAFDTYFLNLKTLELRGYKKLTDPSMIVIAKNNGPKLTMWDLSYCNQITDATILAIAKYCPYLTTLKLKGGLLLTSAAIDTLADQLKMKRSLDNPWLLTK